MTEEEQAEGRKDKSNIKKGIKLTCLTKRILVDIQEEMEDTLCNVCKMYGQNLVECECMQNDECAYRIIELAKKYYRRQK